MKTILRKRQKLHKNLLDVAPSEIIRLEANHNYTSFILYSGRIKTMSYSLAFYDMILPESFIRVNKSCIINKNFIDGLDLENKILKLTDGIEVQVSRRRWVAVRQNITV